MAKGNPHPKCKFPKGGKGGPGRPKTPSEVKEIFAQRGMEAVERLFQFSESAIDERIRYDATKEILNRWLGKPKETHELTGKDGAAIETTSPREILAGKINAIAQALSAKQADSGAQ